MKQLYKHWSALLLTLILAVGLTVPAAAAEPDPVEEAMTAAMTYGGASSISWALWEDGAITRSGQSGVYSKTENRALTSDILYGIGSVSKVYTTAAVMRLAEKHRLSLDAPVTRYLPDFRMADPRYRDITVRMLLNHSSGIMGSGLANAILFDDSDSAATDGLLETLSTQRLAAAPGAYSVYCNDGFTLAELVVEAVSGMEFMDFVRAELLTPAALENTFAPADDFDDSRLAKTYHGDDVRPLPQDCLNAVGAGGLYATAEDLASFGGALTGTSLLHRSSLEAMAAPEYDRGIWPDDTLDALSYGLGWDCVEFFPFSQSSIQALVKGGDTLNYHAGLIVLPEHHMAAAVLSSGGASTYNELAAVRLLLEALAAKGVTVDEALPALPAAQPTAMPPELLDCAGYYGATAAQYQVTVSAEGVLSLRCLTMPSLPAQTFAYHSDGTFRDPTGTAAVAFVREENGKTYLYQKTAGVLPGLGTLPISNYAAVRLEENSISQEVQSAWDTLNTQTFFPLTAKYSSQVYLAMSTTAAQETPETIPGYVGPARIVDAVSAQYAVELPGTGGRDGSDLAVREEDGRTLLTANTVTYLSAEDIPSLFTGSGWAYSTIQDDGWARWYQVDGAAGKTMTVQVPSEGGFWVYDVKGQLTASSVLWGDTATELPEGGFLVFAGAPGARFHLTFTR